MQEGPRFLGQFFLCVLPLGSPYPSGHAAIWCPRLSPYRLNQTNSNIKMSQPTRDALMGLTAHKRCFGTMTLCWANTTDITRSSSWWMRLPLPGKIFRQRSLDPVSSTYTIEWPECPTDPSPWCHWPGGSKYHINRTAAATTVRVP
jgi:hypothetical protein